MTHDERSEVTTPNWWAHCHYRGIHLYVHKHRLEQAKCLIDGSLDHPDSPHAEQNAPQNPQPAPSDGSDTGQDVGES